MVYGNWSSYRNHHRGSSYPVFHLSILVDPVVLIMELSMHLGRACFAMLYQVAPDELPGGDSSSSPQSYFSHRPHPQRLA